MGEGASRSTRVPAPDLAEVFLPAQRLGVAFPCHPHHAVVRVGVLPRLAPRSIQAHQLFPIRGERGLNLTQSGQPPLLGGRPCFARHELDRAGNIGIQHCMRTIQRSGFKQFHRSGITAQRPRWCAPPPEGTQASARSGSIHKKLLRLPPPAALTAIRPVASVGFGGGGGGGGGSGGFVQAPSTHMQRQACGSPPPTQEVAVQFASVVCALQFDAGSITPSEA